MTRWIKISFIGIAIVIIIFTSVYVFLLFKGKSLIVKSIESVTHKKVSIGYFDVTAPLNLKIKNLNIEGLAKVEEIVISPSIPFLLTGRIVLDTVRVTRPEITYEKGPPEITEVTTVTAAGAPTVTPSAAPKKKGPMRLIFRRLNIKDGNLNFIDRTVGADGIKITIKDINFNINNLYVFPSSAITNFELSGRIPWQKDHSEGKIEAEGWLNPTKKDMQATLKIQDIDGVYLYPYYSNWVDLEKARIESAKLNFTSNIQGLNNNVTAECHLELSDIVRKPRPPEEEADKAEKITDAVLDIFRALNQGKIVLDFTIRTKMDRPEFGFGSVKMAFEDKLAKGRRLGGFRVEDVLMLPANILKGAVKGATDLSKAVIDGTFSVGNELKKSVEDTFKKTPKPEPAE